MPVREVLQLGNPTLREVAEPVEDPGSSEVTALVTDLRDTLAHWRRTTGYGRAIAAPQIGIRKRVVFLNLGEPWPMINPAIVERSEETMVVWDACLSLVTWMLGLRGASNEKIKKEIGWSPRYHSWRRGFFEGLG